MDGNANDARDAEFDEVSDSDRTRDRLDSVGLDRAFRRRGVAPVFREASLRKEIGANSFRRVLSWRPEGNGLRLRWRRGSGPVNIRRRGWKTKNMWCRIFSRGNSSPLRIPLR